MVKLSKKTISVLDDIKTFQRGIRNSFLAHVEELEKTQTALRDHEARLRTILDTVVDGVITVDERGVIESFNHSAETIFGYNAEEIVGRNISALMPPPFNRHHTRYISDYLRTGHAKIIGIGREVQGLKKDNTVFPMELAVSEVRLGKRRIFTGIVRDITDRKKTEEAIAMISEKEKQRFGHDLHDGVGQQLTGIALLAKALAQKLSTKGLPEQDEANAITEMVSSVLTEIKVQAHGLYPIELEKLGLSTALAELARKQERIFHIHCKYKDVGSPPEIDIRVALHLYRIAQEAVHNAIKHGNARNITLSLIYDPTKMLTLSIQDDGCGISAKKSQHGGMGLAIMKYRATTLGGVLRIGRGPRGGTVVTCHWKPSSHSKGKKAYSS